ncbi:MAG: hypothetical protein K9N49_00355 [Candidatus Marinimicrobia bacterium]|nr:hypothetical protein [Candidatus Neomarinimicrobiota bacterium]
MSTVRTIEFVLRGKVGGVELTPRMIGLSQFNEFNQQVEAFIAGSQRGKQNETHVEVAEGSYKLRVTLAAAAALALQPDLVLMARDDALGELDPKRAEVVSKWQASARRDDGYEYEIRPDLEALPKVMLTKRTDYRIGAASPWVTVEKYLFGVVEDMGGAQKANIHLRLRDTGQTVIVGASQDFLRDQSENRVYRQALLRVKAEQHFKTGQLRNVRLLAFEDYAPSYDENALNAFSYQGTQAWRDIPDAVAWVREQRGGR